MSFELLNKETISEQLTRDAAWEWSHGAEQHYLGVGLWYYAIVYVSKARVAVCLGSGGGFVPRLMRQAQRDLGIAQTSRTILVDGDYAEAGWGSPTWRAKDSFFRTNFPDVEIICDLTRNAAENTFKKEQIHIDYLHIDADHSFAGCLDDFETYRRFLSEGSIITLHDTNWAGAGVKHVVEHIRTLPDCDVIDFHDTGAGTALVRIGKPISDARIPVLEPGRLRNNERISVTRHTDARPLAPEAKEWKYLESPAFASRYVLAAHWVQSCRSIIEIGGSHTPIDHFLSGPHDSVLVVDPFIRESYCSALREKPCEVSHIRARFQDIEWHIPSGTDYGLVMLGLEIQGLDACHYEVLFQLVNGARVTVMEFPPSWAPSQEQFELIKNRTNTRVTLQVQLDLEGNDFGDLTNSWPPRCHRVMYLLVPR